MTRKTKKEQAQKTRERILDAAEDVFNEKGVSNTALSDVAKMAGVTRGAIYWHFKNKADLFDAMCDRVRQPMRDMIESMADEQTTDPLGRLGEGCAFVMQQVINNPHYRKVFTILFHKCEYLDESDQILIYQKEWKAHGLSTIQRVLTNAQNKGQLPADLDTQLASLMLHVTFDGLLNSWLFLPESFDLVEAASKFHDANILSLKTNQALRIQKTSTE